MRQCALIGPLASGHGAHLNTTIYHVNIYFGAGGHLARTTYG